MVYPAYFIRKSLIDNFHNKSTTKKRKEKKLEILNIWMYFLSTTFLFAIPRNEKNNIKIKSIHTYSLLAQKVLYYFFNFFHHSSYTIGIASWLLFSIIMWNIYGITERRFVDVPGFGVRVAILYVFLYQIIIIDLLMHFWSNNH